MSRSVSTKTDVKPISQLPVQTDKALDTSEIGNKERVRLKFTLRAEDVPVVEVATDSGWFLPPYGTKFLKIKVKFVAKLNKYGKLANDPSSSSPPTIPCDVARGLSRLSFVPYIETSSKFEPGSSLFHQTYKIFMTLWVTTGGGGGGKHKCIKMFPHRHFACVSCVSTLQLLWFYYYRQTLGERRTIL